MRSTAYGEEHVRLPARSGVLVNEVVPHFPVERAGLVPKEVSQSGQDRNARLQVPEEYGGGGRAVSSSTRSSPRRRPAGVSGRAVGPPQRGAAVLLATPPEAKQSWPLPTEPAGRHRDDRARYRVGPGRGPPRLRDGDHYVLNGAKTFITGGINADLVVVVARTSSGGSLGGACRCWCKATPGFSRGRNLAKLGLKGRTPRSCSSTTRGSGGEPAGREGRSATHSNLPQERLAIAIGACRRGSRAGHYAEYVQRRVFGNRWPRSRTRSSSWPVAVEIEARRCWTGAESNDVGSQQADAAKVRCTAPSCSPG